jgi:hypothetical protein
MLRCYKRGLRTTVLRARFSSAVVRDDAAAVEDCSEMAGVNTVRDLAYQASTQQSLLQHFDPSRIRESSCYDMLQYAHFLKTSTCYRIVTMQ